MSKLTKASLKRKAQSYFLLRDRGKDFYQDADAVLDQLAGALEPGAEIDLGGGKVAVLVDAFAEKNVVFRPCGVRRYELKKAAKVTEGE